MNAPVPTSATRDATKLSRGGDGVLMIERFSVARRVEHWLVMSSFILLVLTGLPQRYYEASWGASLLSLFGGLDIAREVHRIAGIVFSALAVLHFVAIVVGTLTKRMRLTLLPTFQDLRDAAKNLKYYLGYRERPPKLPKFDYRQKFEYIGMVLGGIIMVATGLILLFPMTFGSFLPGEWLAASRVAHSNEAVLALLVLVVWHVYGSHLSPAVFPLDKSIFTGKMPVEELKHHHALEYERLFPGGLEEIDGAEPALEKAAGAAEDEVEAARLPKTASAEP